MDWVKHYLQNNILSLFLSTALFLPVLSGCSSAITKKPYNADEHWSKHPKLALSLSKAIVQGMRIMLDDLLISDAWFKDMDISVIADDEELLSAKITNAILSQKTSMNLVSFWRIFSIRDKNMQHIKKIILSTNRTSFDTIEDTTALVINSDVLYLDIYTKTSKVVADEKDIPSRVKVIYWRDVKRNDKIIALDLDLQTPSVVYTNRDY